MICQKCGRVVRTDNTSGKNESITVRRYYCSCGFVNKTLEQVVLVWKKAEYKPREKAETTAQQDTAEMIERETAKAKMQAVESIAKKHKRGRQKKIKQG